MACGDWPTPHSESRTPSDGKSCGNAARRAWIGIIYLYLAYKAARILLDGDAGESSTQQQADTVLDLPGGRWCSSFAALVLAVAGASQLRKAYKCSFLRRLEAPRQAPVVKWLGRIGYTARGVIFLAVAWLIAPAAIDEQSTEAGGMEQVLDLLSGPLLYAVAAGLMLFGMFSIIEARYRRIHEPPVEEIKQEVRERTGG